MIREVRGISPKLLHEISNYDEDIIIGIGSEGCVCKFCSIMDELLQIQHKEDELLKYKIRIITPRVPEKYSDRVIKCISDAIMKFNIDSVVINDYGILYGIKNMIKKEIPLIIGRTLMRSLEYVPWSAYMLRHEEEEVKKNLLIPNILHSSKLELFKKFNIVGTELCATMEASTYIDVLQKKGIKVFVHYNTIIGSLGRTCPVVRINNAKIGECVDLCDSYLEVELNKSWGANKSINQDRNLDIIPKYQCVGNAVYYYKNDNEFQYEICDGVIYDNILNKNEVNNMFCKKVIE